VPADILIRTAGINEKRALEQVQLRASLANPGDRDHILNHPDIISIPDAQILSGDVFVAERNSMLLGFAAMLPNADGTLELDGLFVEPTHWRQGIGNRLVDYCVADARKRRVRELRVVANPHALAFYESCGFKECGAAETLFGPAILMAKIT